MTSTSEDSRKFKGKMTMMFLLLPALASLCKTQAYHWICNEDIRDQRRIDCMGKGLTEIPGDLNLTTTYLFMSRNSITETGENLKKYRNLEYLDLSENLLSNLESQQFEGLNTLKILNLENNSIRTIQDGSFVGLSELQELYFDGCDLTVLKNHKFQGLSRLQVLKITNCGLEHIVGKAFEGMVNLQHLDLSRNKLSSVTTSVLQSLQSLEYLKVDLNSFYATPSSMCKFASLRNVSIAGNPFHSVNFLLSAFHNCPTLESLNLGYCGFKTLKKSDFQMLNSSKIQELVVSGNNFTMVERQALKPIASLQYLIYKGTGLSIKEFTGFLQSLEGHRNLNHLSITDSNLIKLTGQTFIALLGVPIQEMQLSNNKIHEVGNFTFSKMPSLKRIHLNDNEIVTIGTDAFANLHHLEFLNLANNSLHRVSFLHSLMNMSLKQLDLSNNDLHHSFYEDNLQELFQLLDLNLSTAGIAPSITDHKCNTTMALDSINIPQSHTCNLESLDMSFNPYFFLFPIMNQNSGSSFESILKVCADGVICNNMITTSFLQDVVSTFPNAKEISLKWNKIQAIPIGTFSQSGQIQTLDLSFNEIFSLYQGIWEGLKSLKFLNLQGNKMTTLSKQAFENLPSIQAVYLEDNPFHCDCAMQKFLRILVKESMRLRSFNSNENLQILQNYQCTSPVEYPLTLAEFMKLDLTCPSKTWWLTIDTHDKLAVAIIMTGLFVYAIVLSCFCFIDRLQATFERIRDRIKYSRLIKHYRVKSSEKLKRNLSETETQELRKLTVKTYDCDVNLVFEDEDQEWAEENIISILQKVYDLKVCSKEFNFEPGYKFQLADKLIKQCNKTIFILSKKFLENCSLKHELMMALNEREENREVVICVAREDVSKYVSDDMKTIIQLEKYRVYPLTKDSHEMQKFWQWLISEVKSPSDVTNVVKNECC
ncbi:toll-like receptor 4 [Ptychodera flava]|uniref:toll-like receptor 4 n=1 Tax=Ptychodera flava TaxID=63121 RepID=UPI00396A5775